MSILHKTNVICSSTDSTVLPSSTRWKCNPISPFVCLSVCLCLSVSFLLSPTHLPSTHIQPEIQFSLQRWREYLFVAQFSPARLNQLFVNHFLKSHFRSFCLKINRTKFEDTMPRDRTQAPQESFLPELFGVCSADQPDAAKAPTPHVESSSPPGTKPTSSWKSRRGTRVPYIWHRAVPSDQAWRCGRATDAGAPCRAERDPRQPAPRRTGTWTRWTPLAASCAGWPRSCSSRTFPGAGWREGRPSTGSWPLGTAAEIPWPQRCYRGGCRRFCSPDGRWSWFGTRCLK